MNYLKIPLIVQITEAADMDRISAELDRYNKMPIEETPWGSYINKPEVKFVIGHSGRAILLKYEVSEKSIAALHRMPNQPVYKDSCVEFFIAFNRDSEYYNFEFNCVGTCLAGFGPGRDSRELLPVELIKKIKVRSVIRSAQPDGFINWDLTLMIPLEVLLKHQFGSLEGQSCRVNFYKCGDDLPEPHFLAWNNIIYEEPNFHLPGFFGNGSFALASEAELN